MRHMVVHALRICLNWAHYPFVKLNVSMVICHANDSNGAKSPTEFNGSTQIYM